jgi:cytochrome c oxidase subunit 1
MMLPAFYVQSLGQMEIGLLGMRRRIGDYDPTLGITLQQFLITLAAFVIFFSVVIAVINLLYSAARGPAAARNPWRSRSPEFMLPSPLPVHTYAQPFVVVGEPYDYGTDLAYVSIDPDRRVEFPPEAAETPGGRPGRAVEGSQPVPGATD